MRKKTNRYKTEGDKTVDIKKISLMEEVILKNKHIYPLEDMIRKARKQKVLDIVVRTILSQNTSDKLSDMAFSNLKREISDFSDIPNVPSEKIQKLIKVCGLPKVKTKRLKNAVKKLASKFKDPERIREESEEVIFDFLNSIEGIGPKSASVILAFLGFDTFPVDTHVSRIIRRLGITDGSPDQIFYKVSHHIGNKFISHVFLINHGRQICKARNPRCDICVFSEICEHYKRSHAQVKPNLHQDK